MINSEKETAGIGTFFIQKVNDYLLLLKPKLSLLVVFSAIITFHLGKASYGIYELLVLAVGGFLVTAAANTLNQVLEKDYDCLMERTKTRPLAAGRMEVSEAVLAAGIMSVLGLICLASFNPLSAVLGSLSLVSYAFIYTPMKRVSPIAVWIGAIPGALPMAIGWAAATNSLGIEAWYLFALQFFWQFPHFWAIAWVAYKDYSKGGFYLLPSQLKDGRNKSTALQAIFYAFWLLPLSILPYYLEISGIYACIVMFLAGIVYLYYSINLWRKCDTPAAKKLMFASFLYLPVVLLVLVFDKL